MQLASLAGRENKKSGGDASALFSFAVQKGGAPPASRQ